MLKLQLVLSRPRPCDVPKNKASSSMVGFYFLISDSLACSLLSDTYIAGPLVDRFEQSAWSVLK